MIKSHIKAAGLALMICSRALTQLLNFPRSSLYLIILGFLVVLITSIGHIYNKKKVEFIAFILFVFILSLIASGMNSTTIEYFLYFICFGTTTLLVPVITEFKLVLRYIIILGVLLIWPYVSIDYAEIVRNVGGLNENVAATFMDISYKILVFVITGIVLVFTDESWIVKIVASITALIYLLLAFTYGARGALLSVAVFVIIFWIILSKNKVSRRKRISISVVGILMVVLLFAPLVEITFNFLESHDIEARAIERIYDKVSDNESMSTGRDVIYKKALDGIMDSPIWGHGIGSFDNYSGAYPHNIILQLLYEGGILFAIPILFLLIKGIILLFSFKHDFQFRVFVLLLFCSGVVELFLSSHLWMSLFFWMFIGQTLIGNSYKIRNICQKNV